MGHTMILVKFTGCFIGTCTYLFLHRCCAHGKHYRLQGQRFGPKFLSVQVVNITGSQVGIESIAPSIKAVHMVNITDY